MPDAHVLELFAARVENKSLHRRDALYGDRLFDYEPLLQRIEIILRRPGEARFSIHRSSFPVLKSSNAGARSR